MCGIVGFFNLSEKKPSNDVTKIINDMANAIKHRGPDHQGTWVSANQKIALGHRRLAILDLNDAANQPFLSEDKNQILVFNGEIYNFQSIKSELLAEGFSFSTESDTEVLLKSLMHWGLDATLKKIIGMFAFVYVDLKKSYIAMARDRLGEKPLYYGILNNHLFFTSELKTLNYFPQISLSISSSALSDYLKYSCVPGPKSIFENIFKLQPGCYFEYTLNAQLQSISTKSYWSLLESAEKGISSVNVKKSEIELVNAIETVLQKVVKDQMIADVPIGAFLSGGIDSSLITALMQENTERPIDTFTIGFHSRDFDETPYAREVSRHLGTKHHELYVSAEQAQEVVFKLPEIYDEPFADSSQIPTFLVSQMARQHIKVCLSGDGGDEAFAGYNRHFLGSTVWSKLERLPYPFRLKLAKLLELVPESTKEFCANKFFELFSNGSKPPQLMAKLDKLYLCLKSKDYLQMYQYLLSIEQNPNQLLKTPMHNEFDSPDLARLANDPLFTMQYLDSTFYLPNDILVKTDRASMACGLELRAPFLDVRLIEAAWSLPKEHRVNNNKGKWILRRLLQKRIPEKLIERPKSGFAIPIDDWLKGPLRSWAESLIDEKKLKNENYFCHIAVRKLWSEYLAGKPYQYRVWNILMFQAWHDNFRRTFEVAQASLVNASNFSPNNRKVFVSDHLR